MHFRSVAWSVCLLWSDRSPFSGWCSPHWLWSYGGPVLVCGRLERGHVQISRSVAACTDFQVSCCTYRFPGYMHRFPGQLPHLHISRSFATVHISMSVAACTDFQVSCCMYRFSCQLPHAQISRPVATCTDFRVSSAQISGSVSSVEISRLVATYPDFQVMQ